MAGISTRTAPKRHLIVTGTGRAGTTFLLRLLCALGFDTGYNNTSAEAEVEPNCSAGLERDICEPDAPYVIKNPWLCDTLDSILADGRIAIDHALIPMRDLYAAAESRRDVIRRTDPSQFTGVIPGGVWPGAPAEEQEAHLAKKFHRLMETLTRREIPFTLLHFPRLATDPVYLHSKLRPIVGRWRYGRFLKAFQFISRPSLIHDFSRPVHRAA